MIVLDESAVSNRTRASVVSIVDTATKISPAFIRQGVFRRECIFH